MKGEGGQVLKSGREQLRETWDFYCTASRHQPTDPPPPDSTTQEKHLRVVPPGKRLRVPPHTRLEILGSG
jgi:hypothetical protein